MHPLPRAILPACAPRAAGGSTTPRRMRHGLAVVLFLFGWFVVTALTAPAASAHAVVTASTPGDKERLPKAPGEVTIQFSEGITSELGGLKVLSSTGDQVDNSDTSQPTPTSVRVSLRPDLADGTYIANYKVVSADGHPISGAIVFGVGIASIGDVSRLAASNDTGLDVLSKVGQFVMYLGALMAGGLAFFIAFIHDGAPDRQLLGRVTRAATVVATVGIVAVLLAQAGLATGKGLGAAFDLTTLRGILRQGLGWQSATMLIGLAMCHVSVDTKRTVVSQSLAFYGGVMVTASFVLWGHATEAAQPWLSIPADIVHVTMAALWFGGLTGLILVLRARTRAAAAIGDPRPQLAPATTSASTASSGVITSGPTAGMVPTGATSVAVLDRPTATIEEGGDGPVSPAATPSGPDTDPPLPEPGSFTSTVLVVTRFSTAAAISVTALIIAGVALGYTEVGSISSLTSTTYGQLLLVKTAAVSIILFLAMYNRFLLLPWLLPAEGTDADAEAATDGKAALAVATWPTRDDEAEPEVNIPEAVNAPEDPSEESRAEREAVAERAGWRTLLTTIELEALIIVVVLGLTAVLVNTTPARTTVAPAGPFEQTQPFKDGSVSLIVTPNSPGANNFHVDFIAATGTIADPAQKVTLELRLPAKDIGPFTRDMIKGGKGHFLLENVTDMSIAGDWEITLVVRTSDFNQERVTFQNTVA